MTLTDLIARINKKQLLLPNFQREYVWTKEMQKKLIASVLSGVPSSSSLVVQETDITNSMFSCKEIGQKNTKIENVNHAFSYLLDGQQRYTSMFFAFCDQFDSETSMVNEEKLNRCYNKLRNKWYLRLQNNLESNANCIFNYSILLPERNKWNDYLPEDFIDFISVKSNLKDKKKYWSIHKETQDEEYIGCIDDFSIPLHWFFSKNDYRLSDLLRSIAKNKFLELKNLQSENKNLVIALSNEISNQKAKELIKEYKSNSESASKELDRYGEKIASKWSNELYTFLKTAISQYPIHQIELTDINKAISTFEYINTQGTKLSTFDLLCAKAREFDLRAAIIKATKVNFPYFDEIKIELENNFGLIEEDDSITKIFSDYLFQSLNLLHLIKKTKREVSPDVLKQKYSLNKLNKDFLKENFNEAVLAILRASALLQRSCGHRFCGDITNKLAVVPLIYVFLHRQKLSKDILDKARSYYWLKLFSGGYNSHQNSNCANDCNQLKKWLIDNDNNVKDNLLNLLESSLLSKDEFASEQMLTKPTKESHANKSLTSNIMHYIKSATIDFTDWNPDSSSKLIESIDKVEVHHIIPLKEAKSVGESTKKYRKDVSHILNAAMNKTVISEYANRKISDLSITKYGKMLNSFQLGEHFINEDWLEVTFENSNEEEILSLFKSRYKAIRDYMMKDLKNSMTS